MAGDWDTEHGTYISVCSASLIAVRARSRPRVTLNWQRELKDSASRRVCGHPQTPMGFNARLEF